LRYRGYSIEDLADKADFRGVLPLVFGELPTAQLKQFEDDIRKYTLVKRKKASLMVSRTAHPMGVLAALTSALTAFNPNQ
jgi:citrate synthase